MNASTLDFVASTLITRPLPFSAVDVNNIQEKSSLFQDKTGGYRRADGAINVETQKADLYLLAAPSIYSCENGFGEEYGKPFSKGGKYVTIDDFRMLFALGVQHSRRKLMGWRPQYDEVFCRYIGGYPRLSRLTSTSGKTMISRKGNNLVEPPADGKENEDWTPAIPKPTLSSSLASRNILYGVEFTLPYGPQTVKRMIGSFVPGEDIPKQWRTEGGVIYTFERTIHADVYESGRLVGISELLCGEGNMRLKISKYDDIYTNESHKDMYVEVLSTYHIKSPTYTYITHRVETPNKTLPLKNDIRYYLYLEYDDGCRTNFSSLAHDYTKWRFYCGKAHRSLRVL